MTSYQGSVENALIVDQEARRGNYLRSKVDDSNAVLLECCQIIIIVGPVEKPVRKINLLYV